MFGIKLSSGMKLQRSQVQNEHEWEYSLKVTDIKDLVRCDVCNLCDLIVDMGESHSDPLWFDEE